VNFTIPASLVKGSKVFDFWQRKIITASAVLIPAHGCLLCRLSH
jgi:hypothetical protein